MNEVGASFRRFRTTHEIQVSQASGSRFMKGDFHVRV